MSIYKIIDQKVEETKKQYSPVLEDFSNDIKSGSAFMIYSLNTIFKDKEFYNEIEPGIVDSSYRKATHDYGIDAIYLTGSGSLITSVDQFEDLNEDTRFTFHAFQFKKGKGVSQADLLKLKRGLKVCFVDEDYKETQNPYLYDYLTDLDEIKNHLYEKYSSDQIQIKIYICFGGLEKSISGDELLNSELKSISNELDEGGYQNNCIEIFDANRLINTDKKGEEITGILDYEKTFKYITETTSGEKLNGHITIVNGLQIAKLVKEHQTSLFEANIRDYYRRNDLNSRILQTASHNEESKLFWSFNNGLTITCRKVEELPGDKIRLYGIQIVNGCQTSNSLYRAYHNKERKAVLDVKIQDNIPLTKTEILEYGNIEGKVLKDDVTVLIKIIETNDSELIYRITETTNSQTPIKTFSLKANDAIQQLIEEFLKTQGVYYERRLNFWKNKGKRNLVNIQHLFQLYESYINFKPSQVKTRPKAMFNTNYEKVFPDPDVFTSDYNIYLVPIKIDQAITKRSRYIQRQKLETDQYNRMLISHGKFHLGCFVLRSILGSKYSATDIVKKSKIILKELEEDNFNNHFDYALEQLKKVVQNYAGTKKESVPSSLKKTELDDRIRKFINRP